MVTPFRPAQPVSWPPTDQGRGPYVVKAGEIIASMLLTWHNLAFYQDLMRGLRDASSQGMTATFAAQFLKRYRRGGEGESEG